LRLVVYVCRQHIRSLRERAVHIFLLAGIPPAFAEEDYPRYCSEVDCLERPEFEAEVVA